MLKNELTYDFLEKGSKDCGDIGHLDAYNEIFQNESGLVFWKNFDLKF